MPYGFLALESSGRCSLLRKRKLKSPQVGKPLIKDCVRDYEFRRLVQTERYISELERVGEKGEGSSDSSLEEENRYVNTWLDEQREYLDLLKQPKRLSNNFKTARRKKRLFRMASLSRVKAVHHLEIECFHTLSRNPKPRKKHRSLDHGSSFPSRGKRSVPP